MIQLLLLLSLAVGTEASLGEPVPDVRFGEMLNGDGRTRLAEFRGQPVVVLQWTHTSDNCLQYAIPKARELARRTEDGLVVILQETEFQETVDLQAFVLRELPGLDVRCCRLVQDLPVRWTGETGQPCFAVIGADGTLAAEGLLWTRGKQLDDAVKEEMKRLKKGFGESKAARAVRSRLFGPKADLAAALAAADGAGDERDALRSEIERCFEARVAVVRHLVDGGRSSRARRELDELASAASGVPAWESPLADLEATLSTAEFAADLAWEKKLDALTRPFASKRPKPQHGERLRKLAEEAAGSRVASRADALAEAVERATRED
ncbi:MAG: hypothetical protein ACF8XB_17575 [Planctomycetota bacterium JB042]